MWLSLCFFFFSNCKLLLELYLQQLKDWVMYCYFGEKLKTLLVLYSTKMNYWTKLLIHHWCKYLLSFLVVGVYQFFLINCASVLWNNTALMESCFNEWCRQWFQGSLKSLVKNYYIQWLKNVHCIWWQTVHMYKIISAKFNWFYVKMRSVTI